MAVSKRTRFEVLRRDDFTCRYCKSTDGPLTVDHVLPVSLGGTDAPDNLVAACRDCNAGKSSSNPDATTVASVSDDAIRWAAAIKLAAAMAADERQKQTELLAPIYKDFHHWLPNGWEETVSGWLSDGLSIDEAFDCLNIALSKRHVRNDAVFAYACGVARNKVAELHKRARALLEAVAELEAEED